MSLFYRYVTLSCIIASVSISAPLAAQPFAPPFTEFDLNHDGAITEAEFGAARAQRIKERSEQGYQMRGLATAPAFTDLDRNSDGRLNAEEFTVGQMHHRQAPQR
jgi:Ca2+-binding EF-hand superfamily protein